MTPSAPVLLAVSAIGLAVSEVSIRVRSARKGTGSRVDRGSIAAVVAGIGAGVLVAGWCVSHATGFAMPARAAYVGVAVIWLGIGLRQWAVWTLGRFFTLVVRVSEGQPVVDRGPYRWVRHPSYTGLMLSLAGLGLALGNWLSLLALVVLPGVGLAVRIRVEERALLAGLGEPYRAYAERRKRLVPHLW